MQNSNSRLTQSEGVAVGKNPVVLVGPAVGLAVGREVKVPANTRKPMPCYRQTDVLKEDCWELDAMARRAVVSVWPVDGVRHMGAAHKI
jgi:hypothetical protein